MQGIWHDRKQEIIARQLGISRHTVEAYWRSIKRKLEAASYTEAIHCVYELLFDLRTEPLRQEIQTLTRELAAAQAQLLAQQQEAEKAAGNMAKSRGREGDLKRQAPGSVPQRAAEGGAGSKAGRKTRLSHAGAGNSGGDSVGGSGGDSGGNSGGVGGAKRKKAVKKKKTAKKRKDQNG